MRFIDECDVRVEAGDGGNGAIAFRREKFVPFGGPAGGDGGRGGDVVFVGDPGLGTLYDLTQGRVVRAEAGENGQKKDCYGRAGRDREVRVPVGTEIYLAETGERIPRVPRRSSALVCASTGASV
jgi:GTP-binding protein